jgi:nucleoside phosphorylase
VAVTGTEKVELRRATGADAVEMESGIIQSACREPGVPCTTLRAISDRADEDLPLDFNQFTRPDQSVDLPKLLLAVGRSPAMIRPLLKLQRQCREAAERLAAALSSVVEAPR